MLDFEAPPRTARKAGIRAENEHLIIAAAEEVFATYGFRGASISDIASKAGVPKANVYHYFANKEALYARVLERTHRLWGDAARCLDDDDEPLVVLASYIHRKMDMSRLNYFGSKVWASEVMQGAPVLEGYLASDVRPWMDEQVARVRGWIEAGKIRETDPFYLLMMIWATTQHYADFERQIFVLNGGAPLSDEQHEKAKATVTDVILNGLSPTPGPNGPPVAAGVSAGASRTEPGRAVILVPRPGS